MVKSALHMTPEGTPGPTLRRKSEDDTDSHRLSKKPRTRVSYSCGECHRRKQKCDRQIPCSHCIARKVPELCKAYTPGKADQDVHVRLARLEHIVEAALPQYWSQTHPISHSEHGPGSERRLSVSPGPEDGTISLPEEEDLNGGVFESGRWYGKSASGSFAAPSVLEQLNHIAAPEQSSSSSPSNRNQGDDYENESKLLHTPSERSAAENLKSLIQDCGVPPHKISELITDLPPRNISDKLVDYYFTTINWTRYPISEHDFRASYLALCASGTTLNPNSLRFLPLLFAVLSIAGRLAPEHIAGDAHTRKLTSSRYYWCSRRSLLIAAAVQPDCFEMVLTRMLCARFLILDRRVTESWSQLGAAVRNAQALGLHRDGAAMGMERVHVEKRRRIWAHLYHADRSIALVLGRPIAIQDDYTSTLPPSNVDDCSGITEPLPLTTPTRMTFIILRHTLSGIMGRIVHHFQTVRSPSHYSDVVSLDDELLKFMQNLPPHYAVDPDTSLDQSHPYIPVHRFLLVTECLFVRITLHRPYLLRRLGSDRYQRSRDACFESAMQDYKMRAAFLQSTTKEIRDPITSAFREFQAAMIGGIYLVLYPNGPHAATMHAAMDSFVSDYGRGRALDETTSREVKLIIFLKNKSSQMTGIEEGDTARSSRHPPLHSDHQDNKSLLSLRKTTPGPISLPAHPSFHTHSAMGSIPSTPLQNQVYSNRSPVHLLQQAESNSQSGTGSPSGDEESTAQVLLDQWCNIFSGGPTDESTGTMTLPWGTPGLTDLSGWLGPAPGPTLGHEPVPGVDGSDWSYWENLVNQIRSGPVV